MKAVWDQDTVQIEITNGCKNHCANCTRYVGLANPYFMEIGYFKTAVDSMEKFDYGYGGGARLIGIMGGEPLMHPKFEQICEYALSKFPREQLGLWTCFPRGYEKYREVIVKTFANIFLNDHTRGDIHHHPFLVAAKDMIESREMIFFLSDRCFFQRAWSASINPRGAYFCEMAASYAMLCPKTTMDGWPLEKGWWKKTTKDYTSQIEHFCEYCGGQLFLKRRCSIDNGYFDITQSNLDRILHEHPKVDLKKFKLYDKKDIFEKEEEQKQLALYKEQRYRDDIAERYGIFLTLNKKCFNEPHLMNKIYNPGSIFEMYRKRYA